MAAAGHHSAASRRPTFPASASLLFRGGVEGAIEFQHVYTRFAQDAEGPTLRVQVHERAHAVLWHAARAGNPPDLQERIGRAVPMLFHLEKAQADQLRLHFSYRPEVLAALCILPSVASADKLDKESKAWLDQVRFLPDAPPAVPSNLLATAISSGRIGLSWTDNSPDETGFSLERSTDGMTFSTIAVVG